MPRPDAAREKETPQMSEPVLTEIADGIATVTINAPEVRNALTPEVTRAFIDAIARVEIDEAVRCVVLRGAGDHFMAGGDIRNMKQRQEMTPDERHRFALERVHMVHMPILAIRRMGKPVIASVRGAAAGFGVSLVAGADLAIAADDAFFTLAYCHIGLSPDGGSSYFLPRTLGMKTAMEMVLLGDRYDAAAAKEMGLVNRVVPKESLEAETAKLARRLAAGPTAAYANAKALFNASITNSIETQLQMEAERLAAGMNTADHAEGVRAFLEKRKPVFTGR